VSVVPVEAAGNCGVHYVQRGENLFRISLRYGVNMYAVAAANGITDVTRIYAGQTLVIPCGGTAQQPSYPTYHPPVNNPNYPSYRPPVHYPTNPVYQPQYYSPGYVDCRGFQVTSPWAFPNGSINFYWNLPASGSAGISRFQVRIFNSLGREVKRYEALSPAYSVSGDVGLSGIGPGVDFSYVVQALSSGGQVCSSQWVHVQREWNGTANPVR
jgi:hypothetical protein